MSIFIMARGICAFVLLSVQGACAASSTMSPWRAIVAHAYDTIYRPLRAQCTDIMTAQACVAAMYEASSADDQYPWWVRTMLRDATEQRFLHGSWHALATRQPTPTAMCSTEKVATSNWRKFFCLMHGGKDGNGAGCWSGCASCMPSIDEATKPDRAGGKPGPLKGDQLLQTLHGRADWFTFVFLRDPLERFASGYLDKCTGPMRKKEKHCEPLVLYANGTIESERLRAVTAAPMQFGAYVDTFPLAWNLHFYPQSLYCDDLGRRARRYSFAGSMNSSFAAQVRALVRAIDGRAPAEASGGAAAKAAAQSFAQLRESDSHATHAAQKLSLLVTTHAATRLLAYFAIDYVELDMALPPWLSSLPPPVLSAPQRRYRR